MFKVNLPLCPNLMKRWQRQVTRHFCLLAGTSTTSVMASTGKSSTAKTRRTLEALTKRRASSRAASCACGASSSTSPTSYRGRGPGARPSPSGCGHQRRRSTRTTWRAVWRSTGAGCSGAGSTSNRPTGRDFVQTSRCDWVKLLIEQADDFLRCSKLIFAYSSLGFCSLFLLLASE